MNVKSLLLLFVCMASWGIINCEKANSLAIKEISTLEAQNSVDLQIHAGYGLSISFQKTQEVITQIWLADPSRIVFSTNAQDCSKSDNSSCSGNANVIFLRQIKTITFPNLMTSVDGGTQLIVLTTGENGQKQYLFRIMPINGSPEYSSVVVSSSNKP